MRSTLTVETQLLSNEKFGNRSSENVPLNLNLLVSIFCIFVSIFFFQYLVFGFYFYSFTVTFERNSVCYIRFPFPYCVFYFALPSLYPCLLILFQFALRPFSKNAKRRKNSATSISYVFVPCASHFFYFFLFYLFIYLFFYIRSFYNREPPQERERHKNHKFRLATFPVYHAFQ